MTTVPLQRGLASRWAEALRGVPRGHEERWGAERIIQNARWAAVLLALGLTLHLDGGPGNGLWVSVALLIGTSVLVESRLRRPVAACPLHRLGLVAFAGDTLATVVTLSLVSEDPTDPVVTLAIVLAVEAAVRWQLVGALFGGVLGGALAGAWFRSAYGTATDAPPPPEFLVFRIAMVVGVALLLGAMVRELERARHRAATLLELTPELVLTIDRHGRVTSANPAATAILGAQPRDLVGRDWRQLTVTQPAGQAEQRLPTDAGELVRLPFRHADGSVRWIEVSVGDDAAEGLHYLVGRDITERLHDERERSVAEQRYRALFAHNPDAVFGFDLDARIVDVNPAAEALFRRPRTALEGSDALSVIAEEDRDHARAALGRALAGHAQDVEMTLTFPDGGMGHADANLLPIVVDGEVAGVFTMARDVTERLRREAQLEYRASHDQLTGLANRASLLQRLATPASTGRSRGVLFLDLDGFKAVNDAHGHAAGDAVLIEVARRLQAAVRDEDLVCRFAGDEFCVLLTPADATVLDSVAQRITRDLEEPVLLDQGHVRVGASVGATMVEPGEDATAVLARADAAMYAVKRQRHQARDARSAAHLRSVM